MFAEVVTISPKFQIVLPKVIREALSLRAGKKIVVLEKNGQLVLVPLGKLEELRGSSKGLTVEGLREEEDRI